MRRLPEIPQRIRLAIKVVPIAALLFAGAMAKPAPKQAEVQSEERYLSPIEMVLSLDGQRMFVVCEGSDDVRVIDMRTSRVVARVPVGHQPRAIALSPDGRRAYVTNSWNDTVSVVDTATLKVERTLVTGSEPTGVIADQSGGTLYVANRLSNDISVIDLKSGQETKRLLAGRGASYLALSPDGKFIYCTHVYPNPGAHRSEPKSEITVIDTTRQVVVDRKAMPNVAGVFHIAFSEDGRLGAVAQLRPKNLIPLAHVEHGSVFGDSLTLFGADVGEDIQIPIDELDRYYALPWAIAITPDKSKLLVTTAGSQSVTVIDVPKLLKTVRLHPRPFVNDLSASAEYVIARIPVGQNPRGLLLSRDGKRLYVANRLDDNISVIDTSKNKVI